MNFKERVTKELIHGAKLYTENLLNRQFLLYSSLFQCRKFYIIRAYEDNFLHLTGVTTQLSPREFFEKCSHGIINALSDLQMETNVGQELY